MRARVGRTREVCGHPEGPKTGAPLTGPIARDRYLQRLRPRASLSPQAARNRADASVISMPRDRAPRRCSRVCLGLARLVSLNLGLAHLVLARVVSTRSRTWVSRLLGSRSLGCRAHLGLADLAVTPPCRRGSYFVVVRRVGRMAMMLLGAVRLVPLRTLEHRDRRPVAAARLGPHHHR